MGLGHLRRNLLIARELSDSSLDPELLWITGTHEARFFDVPEHVDCLSLPALHKRADGSYRPRRLRGSLSELIALRAAILRSALERFRPDVLLVDTVPRGALGELDDSLRALRRAGTACVLGLRDIGDDPEVMHREWKRRRYNETIREFYDQVWIYGDVEVYDRVRAERMAPDVAAGAYYTGYLDQKARLRGLGERASDSGTAAPFVLCVVGGGQDGERLAELFARTRFPRGLCGRLLTGPFMSLPTRRRLQALARERTDLEVIEFFPEPAALVQRAESVVAMGGYNSVCEVLSFGKRALIVPRVSPRREQLIRARRFSELGLVDMLHPEQASSSRLRAWLDRRDAVPPDARGLVDLNGLSRLPGLMRRALAPAAESSPRIDLSAPASAS
ncbi:MAG: glycosyltransferase family protein [Myxococcota bacterium]